MNILAKNLLILASAGSGKTFQLGNRIIGLVASGVKPERIVALTFTRKAAGEFADALLTKLAAAAEDPLTASALRAKINLPTADFKNCLERVAQALPELSMGTMDSFFSRVVRNFQYELGLTGGRFDLLEGPRAIAMADDILSSILSDALDGDGSDAFLHAFRRATTGKEERGIFCAVRDFVKSLHERFQSTANLVWGPASLQDIAPEEWEKQKHKLTDSACKHLDQINYTRKDQQGRLETAIRYIGQHTICGGSLGSGAPSLVISILNACADPGPLRVKSHSEFVIEGTVGMILREMVELATRCEFSAALQRTRAAHQVIAAYDELCGKRLRQNGQLGFADVKILMGRWLACDEARLRREAIDFRLDARIDHWLLDEFQDTSQADWNGLSSLVDDALTKDEGSVFIVGDRKQTIYAWRGGDVGLFDRIIEKYGDGLEIAPMDESWRSCPEVLDLVNRVCGGMGEIRRLFGEVADDWKWHDHVSAAPLTDPSRSGRAQVELLAEPECALDRVAEILESVGIGQRAMTCGILVRNNKAVRDIADHLRAKGFDVVEEGRRQPTLDNPVGILISHLLKWVSDPADSLAKGVLEVSPLWADICSIHGQDSWELWENLSSSIAGQGFAKAIGDLIAESWVGWSAFGRRRAGDLVTALAEFDARGGGSVKEAVQFFERLEVSQPPGLSAVQVMTIHKAKGLGFDLVILPEIPDEVIPQPQYFEIAEGNGWLTQTPPKWARAMIPELRELELTWARKQRYEALCILYVALTRAKRGLYVLLNPPSKTADPDKPSLANLVRHTLPISIGSNTIFEIGPAEWFLSLPDVVLPEPVPIPARLGKAVPRRNNKTATSSSESSPDGKGPAQGRHLGDEVHRLLEQVGWTDDALPELPESPAGEITRNLVENDNLNHVFKKAGRQIDLLREQPVAAALDGSLITGVIDRLHLHRDPSGRVNFIEIIDFKTDGYIAPSELSSRYSPQMEAYRNVMKTIYPGVEITCLLVAIKEGVSIPIH